MAIKKEKESLRNERLQVDREKMQAEEERKEAEEFLEHLRKKLLRVNREDKIFNQKDHKSEPDPDNNYEETEPDFDF